MKILSLRLAQVAVCITPMVLGSCAFQPPDPRPLTGHLSVDNPPGPPTDIPKPIQQAPLLPEPAVVAPEETYTVVVNDVPARELLFALARDAGRNVDISPKIEGSVTLNAVDQSLTQILDRISRQVDLRYADQNGTLVIAPDTPFLRTYKVDYLNISREATSSVATSTAVITGTPEGGQAGAGGGSSNNDSTTDITNETDHRFWETLAGNLLLILAGDGGPGVVQGRGGEGEVPQSESVIVNREAGLIVVRATERDHRKVRDYIDLVMASVTREVLIEASIIEVRLNDRFQAGIDWSVISGDFEVGQNVAGAFEAAAGGVTTGLIFDVFSDDLDITVTALQEFGDVRVISSPKLMTLNNQTAILKVVDNEVYFQIDFQQQDVFTTGAAINQLSNLSSQVRTVAVGLIMSVTPQVNDADSITLNVRPTISRIREFVEDPAAQIAAAEFRDADIKNEIPVLSVRETESVLKVNSGQTAVIGGLMQDQIIRTSDGVPVLQDINLGGIGNLFKFNNAEYIKSELVIFLRPTVIRTADVYDGDMRSFLPYLPANLGPIQQPLKSPLTLDIEKAFDSGKSESE